MAKKGQSFKGQTFKPQKVKRPPALAKRAQKAYATAPRPGGPAVIPARPAMPAPPPVAQGMPLDPQFELENADALANLQRTQADVTYKRGRAKFEYGFEDTSNPYNRAAMLQRNFEQSQKTNLNTMAGSGQLYSGAAQAVQDEGGFQHGRNFDSLRKEYDDLLHDLAFVEAEAKSGYSTAVGSAALARVQRALENRPVGESTPALGPAVPGSVKGQGFKPISVPRPRGVAKRLQKRYSKAPSIRKPTR